MVHDNPHLEVWRSLSLDQTELNIVCKWSRLNQIEKMILTYHGFPQPIKNLSSPFVVIDDKWGEVISKDKQKGERNQR
jgi:hypothetical protein